MHTTMRSTTISTKPRTVSFDIKPSASLKRSLWAGAVTGEVAGLTMAGVLMAVFPLFLGRGPQYPVQVISSAVLGEPALYGNPVGPVLLGLVLHMLGPSLFWGVTYGFLASKLKIRTGEDAVTLGGVIGIISMVDVYLFVPFIMRVFHDTNIWAREVPIVWDWAAHLIYGLSLGLFPMIFKKIYGLRAGSYRLREEPGQ